VGGHRHCRLFWPFWRPWWTRTPRPIVKGKLGRPVQLGAKVQIVEAEGGYVTDDAVDKGNP